MLAYVLGLFRDVTTDCSRGNPSLIGFRPLDYLPIHPASTPPGLTRVYIPISMFRALICDRCKEAKKHDHGNDRSCPDPGITYGFIVNSI